MRRRRLLGCAGLLFFALALVGTSFYALAVVRKNDPQWFANLPANPFVKQLTVSGTVYAADPRQQENGRTVVVPIAAAVTCNGARTTAGPTGRYHLKLVQADSYACAVSAGAAYPLLQEVVPGTAPSDFRLDFGPSASQRCVAAHGASGFVCPLLLPRRGTLSGTVISDDTHRPATNTGVRCWNPTGSTPLNVDPHQSLVTHTDGQGRYTFAAVPVDHYVCNGYGDSRVQAGGVAPGAATTLNLPLCQAQCPAVSYLGGPVMHSYTAYLVYWLPQGDTYDALGTASFEQITSNYFKDIGGTAFYNLVTQYWDYTTGPISNGVQLGGTWTDTHAYPHAATQADPLADSDIVTEVNKAIAANKWTVDNNHAVFVFTGYGAEICNDTTLKSCSFSPNDTGFCGYHSYIPSGTGSGSQPIYAEIVDNYNCMGGLWDSPTAGPNGDRVADSIVDVVSHEQFESATDPLINAWYDIDQDSKARGEIGDKCEHSFATVQLGNGHTYFIQPEWSDSNNGCAYHL